MNDKKRKVKCLGWCDKEFMSPDPTTTRFCDRCKRQRSLNNLSKREENITNSSSEFSEPCDWRVEI